MRVRKGDEVLDARGRVGEVVYVNEAGAMVAWENNNLSWVADQSTLRLTKAVWFRQPAKGAA